MTHKQTISLIASMNKSRKNYFKPNKDGFRIMPIFTSDFNEENLKDYSFKIDDNILICQFENKNNPTYDGYLWIVLGKKYLNHLMNNNNLLIDNIILKVKRQ